MVSEAQLQSFMSDPDLMNLIEHVKVSDDMLDVIKLSETQHSSMLAWCLTPGEGHGQGDAVIKDFLTAGYQRSMENGCTHDTKRFFSTWTPARVRRTSFGSAFITREFHVKAPDLGRRGLLDLLLVDPQNKILIAIENKVGAELTQGQLSFYSETVNKLLGSRPVFKDFAFAFVVIDRELSDYDQSAIDSLGKRWCLLDYSWLETAAVRAKQHVERNNQAAQLLMAYCQSLTDWEKPTQTRTSEIAATLAERHQEVVNSLKDLRGSSVQTWTPRTLSDGDLSLFFHQHRQLCRELIGASGIPGMAKSLQKKLGDRAIVEKNGPTRMTISTRGMLSFQKSGELMWPMYLLIRKRNHSDPEARASYDLRFIVYHPAFREKPGPVLVRTALNGLIPGLAVFPESTHRRITIGASLTADRAVALAVEWTTKIDDALAKHFPT